MAGERDLFGLERKKEEPVTTTGDFDILRKPVRLNRIARIRFYYNRTSLASILIIVILGFSIFKMNQAKAEFAVAGNSAERHLTGAMEAIDRGDLGRGLAESNAAAADIARLKFLTQVWGQDIRYLNLLPSRHSKAVAYERLLGSTYTVLSALTSISQELGRAIIDDSKSKAVASGSEIFFDFGNLQGRLLSQLAKNSQALSGSRRDLGLAEEVLPENLKAQTGKAIGAIDKTERSIENFRSISDSGLSWLFGQDDKEKKVLVLFQNNGELRGGSGGSLGSFGLARFNHGKLENIDFGVNIYKIDNAFRTREKIEPPSELIWICSAGWSMKDAGWAVDGPEALNKVVEYYQKETGNSVDGVINVDTTAVIDVLREIGPIDLPQYQKSIGADNFRSEIEYEVHKGYFERPGGKEENEPKKILAEMMPAFFDKMFASFSNETSGPKVLGALAGSIKKKDVIFYFNNPDLQREIESLNYAGKINHTLGDYLSVNSSNIDGAKSSQNIEEKVKLSATINGNGTIKNVLDLTRAHRGNGQWPDGVNKNFIRLLLPEGSKITNFEAKAGNFERFWDQGYLNNQLYWLTNEAGKTAANFWQSTRPGEQSEAVISYDSSYRLETGGEFNYFLTVQKQPGAPPGAFELTLNYPAGFAPVNVEHYDPFGRQIILKESLESDKEFVIKFKPLLKRET